MTLNYFYELGQMDPVHVCDKLGCRYDYDKSCYTLTVWNDLYSVWPQENKILQLTSELPRYHPFFGVFVAYYMTHFQVKEKLDEEWISEKDVLGGKFFFRKFHKIPTSSIVLQYQNKVEKFKKKCVSLYGSWTNLPADAAYTFKIVPGIDVAVLYWKGNHLFDSEFKLLFKRSVGNCLPPDVIFALATDVCIRLRSS